MQQLQLFRTQFHVQRGHAGEVPARSGNEGSVQNFLAGQGLAVEFVTPERNFAPDAGAYKVLMPGATK
jgi:hypothetical protein